MNERSRRAPVRTAGLALSGRERLDDDFVAPPSSPPPGLYFFRPPLYWRSIQVDAVFIAGKARKWRGKLVGVDLARVMRLATEARDSLWHPAGCTVDFMA